MHGFSGADIEGKLIVAVHWDGRRITRAAVASQRPLGASRVLEGGTPDTAVQRVSLLFSICGRAQRIAALSASEAARGIVPDPEIRRLRELLVLGEAAQEHLWRLCQDWPSALGRSVDLGLLLSVRKALHRVGDCAILDRAAWAQALGRLDAFLREEVFGVPVDTWLAMGLSDFDVCCREAVSPMAALLRLLADTASWGASPIQGVTPVQRPAMIQAVLAAMAQEEHYAARPHWQNRPLESGPLVRMQAHPVVAGLLARAGNTVFTRVVARCLELADLAARMHRCLEGIPVPSWIEALPLGGSIGAAAVETARGLLLHRVDLHGGRVARYRIVAPTEWNFHPAGALAQGLAGLPAADARQARQRAVWLILALDPCVGYEVELRDA